MYQIKVDCHTHTIFSGHAYGTLEENLRHASEIGLEGLSIADHCGKLFLPLFQLAPYNSVSHFVNYKDVPETCFGVRLLRSAEMDINDLQGNLFGMDTLGPRDKPIAQIVLDSCDLAIASVHSFPEMHSGTTAQYTEMYCNAIRTPGIHILGHIGRTGLPFDIDEVLLTAKECGKMIELNNHSFEFDEAPKQRCKEIALRCAELGVMVAVNRDAHSSFRVGTFEMVTAMMEEIHFPQELIAIESLEKLLAVVQAANEKQNYEKTPQ